MFFSPEKIRPLTSLRGHSANFGIFFGTCLNHEVARQVKRIEKK